MNRYMRHSFKSLLLVILCLMGSLSIFTPVHAAGKGERYVVVVSMDGYRWDYGLMYRTPFLDQLGEEGVYARVRPSYPSKTFPNHYTIATGLVPDHHGIIANVFVDRATGRKFSLSTPETKFDGYFYGGEPLWVTAQKQGIPAGIVYWPGSDVQLHGMFPSIYHKYQGDLLSYEERVSEVKRMLSLPEGERPHLVMCYFDEPDHTGHSFGPIHPNTRAKVELLDSLMSQFYDMLQSLPIADQIDLIITSDHGMAMTSPERLVKLSDYVNPEWIEYVDYSIPVMLDARHETRNGVTISYADSILAALRDVPHIDAWRREEVPAYLQFGSNENIGEIVVNPDLGWIIDERYRVTTGCHGFNPYESDMQVLFRAIGPDFKQHYVKPTLFQNIDIYPLVCHLLGIEPAPVDGSLSEVEDMLR